MRMEGVSSGMPDTTVEPSGGGVGLIQPKTDEGRCLLGNPNAHAFFVCCFCCILLLRFYSRAVMLLCLALVGYRLCMFYCEAPFTCFTVKCLYGSWEQYCALLL